MKDKFSSLLEQSISEIDLIKKNPYCKIYRACSENQTLIIKEYREDSQDLAIAEAKYLNLYSQISSQREYWLDCWVVSLVKENNLLAMTFVPGVPLNKLLYQQAYQQNHHERLFLVMERLGELLARLSQVETSDSLDPFFSNYLEYCSTKLQNNKLLGKILWSQEITTALSLSQKLGKIPNCFFAHGDFVPLNIHVDGERVGLIDFANSNTKSHFLNDWYNFRFALDSMRLPKKFKQEVWHSFEKGFGKVESSEIAHEFFFEFHRRRWLMLKACSKNPYAWWQLIAGNFSFAQPYKQNLLRSP